MNLGEWYGYRPSNKKAFHTPSRIQSSLDENHLLTSRIMVNIQR